ncbi:MAG: hypothetical protein JO065_18805, partial [Acidobacteria bacterium]|nr:hypothetical protein [Acidobacteriota bacterium]
MTETIRGGTAKPVEPGMLARFGQRLRQTYEVWFGPLLPLPQVAPPDTHARRFDYPSGANLVTLPRNFEAVSFQQMRDLADSLDLVRIAIETRKDQVSKMPWLFRRKTRARAAEPTAAESKSTTSTSSINSTSSNDKTARIEELTEFFESPDREHGFDDWIRMVIEELLVIDAVSLA